MSKVIGQCTVQSPGSHSMWNSQSSVFQQITFVVELLDLNFDGPSHYFEALKQILHQYTS
ncbi:Uncharacterized protein DAT39_014370 [Clarias magur]|uniref:Uncharacterized protein n=1 Tax=Clarias magur TaxID=1594786 RepID=A0A8J4TIF6_CLAMG|nr:Uncharacterized protein DAT39_014370 [Clarias magur]